MGDIADMMVEGLLCEQCGGFIDGEEPGYPRNCGCEPELKKQQKAAIQKVGNRLQPKIFPCAGCNKKFRTEHGATHHYKEVHVGFGI